MTEKKLAAQQPDAQQSEGPATPQGQANSAAANLRHGFYAGTRAEVLLALGEDPEKYLDMMQSIKEDLQPRPGLEKHLVAQVGECLWGIEGAQRMREGLAMKRIQCKVVGETMRAMSLASKAIEQFEPFERLMAASSRRGGPTEEDINAFIE